MVYYGALSRGCQLCRQRKIKCDERKPQCLKCIKSNRHCPGYRNLSEVLFRDESTRIIQKVRREQQSGSLGLVPDTRGSNYPPSAPYQPLCALRYGSTSISSALSESANDLAGHFFFAKYNIFTGPPYSTNPGTWLAQEYGNGNPSHVLRATIEAVGMAGMSNSLYQPNLVSKSRTQYGRALAAMKHALDDPVEAIADTTLMAVILLGLFEVIQFESSGRDGRWAAHAIGAMTLLKLRGRQQFAYDRGAQLFILIRSQILLACMQQGVPVPPELVDTTYTFQTSLIRENWRCKGNASPGSICEISFRLVNLRAAIASGELVDPRAICARALEIEADLDLWEAAAPVSWKFTVGKSIDMPSSTCFDGKCHKYPNLWVADAWTNWRMLKILVNQTILQYGMDSSQPNCIEISRARSVVSRLSTDICVSIPNFANTPQIMSLIQPLYLISMEEINTQPVRAFALEQLRQISLSMGIRQASQLANVASEKVAAARDLVNPSLDN